MVEVFIPSDYAPLQTVLVQTPGNERRHINLFASDIDLPGFTPDMIGEDGFREHQGFQKLLENAGVKVLEVHAVLNSAIAVAKQEGTFHDFIAEKFPRFLRLDPQEIDRLSAWDFIGSEAATFFPSEPGQEAFLSRPLQWMYYTRDFAVTLPHGVVLTAYNNKSRQPETSLARFMFQNAPQLKDFPIIFDAEEEGVEMQGGDMIMLNEHTLLMGVDNLSSREAAQKLARKTGMNVLGVQMPLGPTSKERGDKSLTELNLLFLHLDTIMNIVDTDKAVALTYLLQDEYDHDNPISLLLDSIDHEQLSISEKQRIQDVREALKGFGNVTVYEAGTGNAWKTSHKIVSYLQQEYGYKFAFAGGEPKSTPQEQLQHLVEDVLPEIRFQAANVVVTEPGKVLMYRDDTRETQGSLRRIGVEVTTFDAHELVRWNGGPHCMTMPLRRGN